MGFRTLRVKGNSLQLRKDVVVEEKRNALRNMIPLGLIRV